MNPKVVISAIVILVGAAGAFVYFSNQGSGSSQDPVNSLQNQQMQQNLGETVATVNGEEITRYEMQTQLQQLMQTPQAQQQDENVLQEQAINQVVDVKLLVKAAKDENITVEEEAVENEMQTLLGQFEDESVIDQQLSQVGMTRESLREDVRNQLILNQYFDQIAVENNVDVTSEEIEEAYNQQLGTQEGAPALEEVSSQIESQLKQQKIQPFLGTIIESYRESAQIEILI